MLLCGLFLAFPLPCYFLCVCVCGGGVVGVCVVGVCVCVCGCCECGCLWVLCGCGCCVHCRYLSMGKSLMYTCVLCACQVHTVCAHVLTYGGIYSQYSLLVFVGGEAESSQ